MPPSLPRSVTLREVAPRDGFQSLATVLPTEFKCALIRRAADAGLNEIEVTSSVSPKLLPQLADCAEVLDGIRNLAITRAVLAPTAGRAAAAISAGADQVVAFLSASEAHNETNVKRPVAASLKEMSGIFSQTRDADAQAVGAIAVSFGCPYEGHVPQERVLDIAARLADAGADMLIFGDTTGMAIPTQVADFVGAFREKLGDMPFSLHFHNNRNLAMANLYAALCEGATIFDTAIGGIGGCPTVPQAAGNLATEDVVLLLDGLDVESGVDLAGVIGAARFLEKQLGNTLPGQVMKSGPIAVTGADCLAGVQT
jgi:hydroxymethylglutaryl-CoA lyase